MVTPELSLELRIRFLETLLTTAPSRGGPSSASSSTGASTMSLTRRADLASSQLKEALESGGGGEAVRRFVQNYDLNEPLLNLPPATGPEGDDLTPQAKIALILESESEIRQLERELREMDTLDERGVVGAGKLADHEALKSGLAELRTVVAPLSASTNALESKSNVLLARYNDYINSLSEFFIAWNSIVEEAEDELTKLEKERQRVPDVA